MLFEAEAEGALIFPPGTAETCAMLRRATRTRELRWDRAGAVGRRAGPAQAPPDG